MPKFIVFIETSSIKSYMYYMFDIYEDAQRFCAKCILKELENMIKSGQLMMSNQADKANAIKINSLIAEWNIYTAINLINTVSNSFFSILRLESEQPGCVDAPIPHSKELFDFVYKHPTPGATCRKCNQSNEYSNPDKNDGTYICVGCKMMQSVFGI